MDHDQTAASSHAHRLHGEKPFPLAAADAEPFGKKRRGDKKARASEKTASVCTAQRRWQFFSDGSVRDGLRKIGAPPRTFDREGFLMSFKSPRRILPRASGGRYRVPMGTAAMDDLEHAIRAEARRFNVSCSFVIHTAVAYALGINSDDYHAVDAPPRKRAGRVIAMPHGRRRAS